MYVRERGSFGVTSSQVQTPSGDVTGEQLHKFPQSAVDTEKKQVTDGERLARARLRRQRVALRLQTRKLFKSASVKFKRTNEIKITHEHFK